MDLGDVDVVLLLIGADLELFENEILGDLGGLRLEVGHLIGRDGTIRHDHHCGDRGYEKQAHDSYSDTAEHLHSAPGTWLRRRARIGTVHDYGNV